MSKWLIRRVGWNQVSKYLEDGYEPFAVHVSGLAGEQVDVFLRRLKDEEA